VIVPTRNSAQLLEFCLQSIQAQTYPHIELIVVDNFSDDGTTAIARRHTPHVFSAGPERSAQRNVGAQRANGAYVLFVDSDMALDPEVVGQCVERTQRNPTCVTVIIPEVSVGEGFWSRCKALERSCYVGDNSIEAARFFVRDAFEQAGGYDESLNAFEDWDLARRVGQRGTTGRIEAFIEHMEGRLTLLETMRAKFYYGKTVGSYLRRHSDGAVRRQFVPVRAAYIRHWRRLVADPLHLSGFIVMKTCEMLAGGVGALTGLRRGVRHGG
jgi:glycosyltransferase involved in cell wall biosynthesis